MRSTYQTVCLSLGLAFAVLAISTQSASAQFRNFPAAKNGNQPGAVGGAFPVNPVFQPKAIPGVTGYLGSQPGAGNPFPGNPYPNPGARYSNGYPYSYNQGPYYPAQQYPISPPVYLQSPYVNNPFMNAPFQNQGNNPFANNIFNNQFNNPFNNNFNNQFQNPWNNNFSNPFNNNPFNNGFNTNPFQPGPFLQGPQNNPFVPGNFPGNAPVVGIGGLNPHAFNPNQFGGVNPNPLGFGFGLGGVR